ncbi:hypothetical protein OUZ56_019237 [Daphnia magna]|uniref:Uncharacterized protein n=1 Tax=Daphnia magna TaxID=35525 RepID=A0ABQ9ZB27_9CRUS|nr:hypothetical protein OUZ56_019237 [Daphnia magna]
MKNKDSFDYRLDLHEDFSHIGYRKGTPLPNIIRIAHTNVLKLINVINGKWGFRMRREFLSMLKFGNTIGNTHEMKNILSRYGICRT